MFISFPRLGKFSAIISSNKFSASFSHSSLGPLWCKSYSAWYCPIGPLRNFHFLKFFSFSCFVLGELYYLVLQITNPFFAPSSLLLNPCGIFFSAATLYSGGLSQLVCRSFSEGIDQYVAVASLPQWEEVSLGSSYFAVLNCLQGLTVRNVSLLAKLQIRCLLFLIRKWKCPSQLTKMSPEHKLHESVSLDFLVITTSPASSTVGTPGKLSANIYWMN